MPHGCLLSRNNGLSHILATHHQVGLIRYCVCLASHQYLIHGLGLASPFSASATALRRPANPAADWVVKLIRSLHFPPPPRNVWVCSSSLAISSVVFHSYLRFPRPVWACREPPNIESFFSTTTIHSSQSCVGLVTSTSSASSGFLSTGPRQSVPLTRKRKVGAPTANSVHITQTCYHIDHRQQAIQDHPATLGGRISGYKTERDRKRREYLD